VRCAAQAHRHFRQAGSWIDTDRLPEIGGSAYPKLFWFTLAIAVSRVLALLPFGAGCKAANEADVLPRNVC